MFYPPTGEEIAEGAGLVMPGLESPALNPELPCLSSRPAISSFRTLVWSTYTQRAADLNGPSRTCQVLPSTV